MPLPKNSRCFTIKRDDNENMMAMAGNQSYDGISLRNIYGIPFIKPTVERVVKVAIVICYHNPTVLQDLRTYWNSACNLGGDKGVPFPKVRVHTMANILQADDVEVEGWNTELCLDLQMVANANPYADIWVVEAASPACDHLCSAVEYAAEHIQADVISMSWGGADDVDNISYNQYYTNPNVIYCASSGDTNNVSWPSVLSNMMSIGGTSLESTGIMYSAVRTIETTWPKAGCGFSTTVDVPDYQRKVNKTQFRSSPDVALVANPQTGVNVISRGNQIILGGTSVSCPIFAGMVSVALQQRYNLGITTPLTSVAESSTDIHKFLYEALGNKENYYDVQKGQDGDYRAAGGFDVATGLGVPTWKCLFDLSTWRST
jgi:subtilase family serine protease